MLVCVCVRSCVRGVCMCARACVCVCVRVVMLLLVNHFATRVVDIWCWLSAIAVLVVGHTNTFQSLPPSPSPPLARARARALSLSRALSLYPTSTGVTASV